MKASSTPDFRAGIEVRDVPDGAIVSGRVDSDEAILIRRGDAYFAVGAQCMLGRRQRFDAVPFFWSQHYDLTINYTGHAQTWDTIDIDGSLSARDCAVTYKRGGRILAVASISRNLQSLEAERNLETT